MPRAGAQSGPPLHPRLSDPEEVARVVKSSRRTRRGGRRLLECSPHESHLPRRPGLQAIQRSVPPRNRRGSGEADSYQRNAVGRAHLPAVPPGRQARSRREHAALDGGPDAFADLLGQRRLCRSIKLQPQRLGHTPWYTIFVRSWYFFMDHGNGTYGGQRSTTEQRRTPS